MTRYGWWLLIVMLTLIVASALASAPADVAIVPGCPTAADGTLSHCQQRRVAWVTRLWREGRIENVITSGGAVYNPYVEADTMADALIALGIPEERVHRERDAMHTDENMAWSLTIAEQHGFDDILVATDMLHAGVACAMVRAWSDARCTPAPVDYRLVSRDVLQGAFRLPWLLQEPLSAWIPLGEREAGIAAHRGGEARGASLPKYLANAVGGMKAPRPAPPPAALRTPPA